jgi:hypothetical protein
MAGDEVKRTNKNMEAIYNPSTPEAEVGRLWVQDLPQKTVKPKTFKSKFSYFLDKTIILIKNKQFT